MLITTPDVPFRTRAEGKNIVFVSQWDNFPKQATIPVGRPASHAYLLMASVTNACRAAWSTAVSCFIWLVAKKKRLN